MNYENDVQKPKKTGASRGQAAPSTPNFESIKRVNDFGMEYWSARELQSLLGYTSWRRFAEVIKRARIACEQSRQDEANHFAGSGKVMESGRWGKQTVVDFTLSRYACYLIAINGEPTKPEIAAAQTYFTVQTRKQEMHELRERQEQRLQLREHATEENKKLAKTAQAAGVNSQSFGIFIDAGYKGLYGGIGVAGIKKKKGIEAREDIQDRMGAKELALNVLRITQTEETLRTNKVADSEEATAVHHQTGTAIRAFVEEQQGILPEDLPAEPSLKPLLEEKKRTRKKARLTSQGQEPLL